MECEKELRILAETIRLAREEKGMTQENLAELLDVSTTHVRHLESGHRRPSIEKLLLLCKILDFSFNRVVKQEV